MLHFELKPTLWKQSTASWESLNPPCEIVDSPQHYSVALDIPGFRKEDIEIELKDHHLIVSGTRTAKAREETDKVLRQERRYGQFQRIFSLPDGIREEAVSAQFTDGVLEIVLPKAEVAGRKIVIN
jgi:HSP20 family protein